MPGFLSRAAARNVLPASLSAFPCPSCRSEQAWARRRATLRRRASTIAFVCCRGCGFSAVLKEFHEGSEAVNEANAARQFEAARAAMRSFEAEAGLSIARPLALSGAAMLLADVPGKSPLPIFDHGALTEASRVASAIGEWFATYHRSWGALDAATRPHVTLAQFDMSREVADLEIQFRSVGAGDVPASSVFEEARRLVQAAPPIAQSACVRLHGDSKPGNFLFDGEVLYGIDIEGRFLGMPECDLAQFEVQLRASTTTWYGAADQVRLKTIATALAAGYRRRLRLDSARLDALRLVCLLRMWLKLSSPSVFGAWRWNAAFARHAEGILSEMNEAVAAHKAA